MTQNDLRKKAAEFYYKHLDGLVLDWIEGRVSSEGIDPDVVSLAELLEQVYAAGQVTGQASARPTG